MKHKWNSPWLIAALVCACAAPAAAQLSGLGRGLGGALSPITQLPGRLTSQLAPDLQRVLDPETLLTERLTRIDALVSDHPREIDRDNHGAPVVRGEVLAIALTPEALAQARAAGFAVRDAGGGPDDGVGLVVLTTPGGMSAREAVTRLRKLDPGGAYDFNHLYLPSGETGPETAETPVASAEPDTTGDAHAAVRIGLIDTGIDETSPVFAGARLEQKAFSGPVVRPAPHGAAVASLIVGRSLPFKSAAPGAQLYAADVYGGAPAGGAADALVRALGWMAARKVAVVNVSLVGPPNLALAAAIRAVQARGIAVVAAVGNDGPAAPPAYPASYPGVIAVTGVDAHGQVLLEAGRSEHLDFAAPGADMAAAGKGGGFVAVRGTSFAAPLVAGRLAVLMIEGGPSLPAAEDTLAREGRRGQGYGRALVAMQLRTPPASVHAAAGRAD